MSGSSERKSKAATAQKLRKARRDGTVPQSQKVVTLVGVSATLGALLLLFDLIKTALSDLFDAVFKLIGTPFAEARDSAMQDLFLTLFRAVAPVLGLAVGVVILTSIAYHRGIPFSAKPLVPDFNRLNPAEGFKRLLGRRSWIEVGVGLVQLLLWGTLAGVVILAHWRDLFELHSCGLPCLAAVAWQLFRSLAVATILLFLLLAVLETVLQRALYNHEQKMTLTEYKREMKDNYGSPEINRARARLRAENDYFDTVDPDHIDAEMANMCFYSSAGAVAIRYHPKVAPVPYICVHRTGNEAESLRDQIRNMGFPETKSRKVVETCLQRPEGTPVPQSIHKDLAAGIARMFK